MIENRKLKDVPRIKSATNFSASFCESVLFERNFACLASAYADHPTNTSADRAVGQKSKCRAR